MYNKTAISAFNHHCHVMKKFIQNWTFSLTSRFIYGININFLTRCETTYVVIYIVVYFCIIAQWVTHRFLFRISLWFLWMVINSGKLIFPHNWKFSSRTHARIPYIFLRNIEVLACLLTFPKGFEDQRANWLLC